LRGNEQAWGAVVDRYKNLVYAAPIRCGLSPQDAAAVFQEVWRDLFSGLGNLQKPGALKGWLISTAAYKCLEWMSRRVRMADLNTASLDRCAEERVLARAR
jgi:DNA-directed RNA polymerase specialized sigma24 family protein